MVSVSALAPICPALRTPTPCSVPIRWILPAYIPPSSPTSMATCGFSSPASG
ncbi:hypothetical protein COI_0220 [Mannheimia haemolytica serotype A2 str. OVINE]|nr:hypothetical protein COI_0220 [Mannheimia haemolytica serotype A2 str. OVINE]